MVCRAGHDGDDTGVVSAVFGGDAPVMVRLTLRQHGRVQEIVADQMSERWRAAALEWMQADVNPGAKHRVDVVMPTIAWMRVRDVLFDHCYDNRGFRTKGVRTTDLNALKSIQQAVNVRTCHPGLHGIAAIGHVAEIIPAWKLTVPAEDGRAYASIPAEGSFVILAPEARKVGAHQTITSWVEAILPLERPLLDEAQHLRFA